MAAPAAAVEAVGAPVEAASIALFAASAVEATTAVGTAVGTAVAAVYASGAALVWWYTGKVGGGGRS